MTQPTTQSSRAARHLATWDRIMAPGTERACSDARRWMLTLSDEECEEFLDAHQDRIQAREAQ